MTTTTTATTGKAATHGRRGASASLDGGYTFAIDTAMLQSYHSSSVPDRLRVLCPRTNDDGTLDVLALDSSGQICFLFPSEESDSGWEMIRTDIPCTLLAVAPAIDGGAQRMFGANNLDGQNETEIFEITYQPGESEPNANDIVKRTICQVDRGCDSDGRLAAGLAVFDGNPDCFLVLSGGPPNWLIVNTISGEWFYTDLGALVTDTVAVLVPQYSNRTCGVWPEVHLAGGIAYSWGGVPASFLFTTLPDSTRSSIDGHPAVVYGFKRYVPGASSLSAHPSISGYQVKVGADSYARMFFLPRSTTVGAPGGEVQAMTSVWNWEGPDNGWSVARNFGSAIAENIDGGALELVDARLNMKELFELTLFDHATGDALHCYQQTPNDDSSWTSWLPVARNCSAIGVGQFRNGFTQIFAAGLDDSGLTRFYQTETTDPNAAGVHDWTRESITWKTANDNAETLSTGQCYRTVITVFDANGAPAPGVSCAIDASDFLPCYVNNSFSELQPGQAAVFETNGLGQIAIESILDCTLYSPSFSITPENGSTMTVRPDRDTVAFLQHVTPGDVGKLLPDTTADDEKVAVASAITNAAAILKPLYAESAGNAAVFAEGVNPAGVSIGERTSYKERNRLDPARTASQPWLFSVATGRAEFRALSTAEYERLRTSGVNAREGLADIFGGVSAFFGDVWEAASDVAESVTRVVVSGTAAAVTFVVDGIDYVIDAAMECAEDVFDVVGAILEQAGVLLGQVLVWVLESLGFLFDWTKIVQMKGLIKSKASKGFDEFRTWLAAQAGDIQNRLGQLLAQLPGEMQADAVTVSGTSTGQSPARSWETNLRSSVFTVNGNCFWDSGTWLIDQARDKIVHATLPDFDNADALNALGDVLDRLDAALGDEASSQLDDLRDQVLETFNAFLEDPVSLLSETLDSMITLFKEVLGSLVGLAEAVTDICTDLVICMSKLLDSLFLWLDKEIYIPFISAFYKTVVKGPLSLLDLACLCLAVPATVADAARTTAESSRTTEFIEGEDDDDVWIRLRPYVTALAVLVGEATTLQANRVDDAAASSVEAIVGDLFNGIASAIWVGWDALEQPANSLGFVITLQCFVDLAARVYKTRVHPEDGSWGEPALSVVELLTGGGGVAAGVLSIVTSESSSPPSAGLLLGVASILMGIRMIISGGAGIAKSDLKKSQAYGAYVSLNTMAMAGLFIETGRVGAEADVTTLRTA